MSLVLTVLWTSAIDVVLRAQINATPSMEPGAAQARVDVNARRPDGSTELHWAVHRDDAAAVQRLLRAGADPNAVNELGTTSLSLACTNGNADVVAALIAAGADVNAALVSGETALMTCAKAGSRAAVTALVDAGANVNAAEPSQEQTALMWAAAHGHASVVEELLARGASIEAVSKSGFTALHFAARNGSVQSAARLLAAGADINALAKDGSTPLLVATVRGNVDVARLLLDHHADPNILAAGFVPLHWAAGTWETQQSGRFGFVDNMSGIVNRADKIGLVEALLAHGADPNVRTTKSPPRFGATNFRMSLVGATPFFLAAFATDVELMKLLVAAGADPRIPTSDGTTPLMAAAGLNRVQGESRVADCEQCAIDAVELALALGNDLNARNDDGESCLHAVAYLGFSRLMELLLDKGADVNVVSKKGLTPYLIASGHGDRNISATVVFHKALADMLIKRGANPALGVPID